MHYLESNPVSVTYPEKWTLPMIFSSPHSGAHYPDRFVEQSNLDLNTLRRSEDYNVHHLFDCAPEFGAPLLKANFPRAFCDVNREAYELDPDMFSDALPGFANKHSPRVTSGIGTIPRLVSADTEIHREKLTFAEAEERINNCYFPYHAALATLLETCQQRFGFALLVDCHSMPGNATAAPGDPHLGDMVLGNRFGRTCPPELSDFVADTLSKLGYSVSFNTPYAGGYITRHYADPIKRIYTLQIEISRDLYMDQPHLQLTEGAPELVANIRHLLGSLHSYFQKFAQKV